MLLVNTINKRLSASQIAALQRIDDEDFSGVRRKVAEELSKQGRDVDNAYLDAGISALKLYYALPVLDPFWHMHILHTKQYAAFCQETVGAFMHHDPLDHSLAADVAQVQFLYDYTIGVLSDLFGELDPQFYPQHLADAQLVCTHGDMDYSSIGDSDAIILPRVAKAQQGAVFAG